MATRSPDPTAGFLDYLPTDLDYLRGVILFGKNSATYKFALGKSLFDLASAGHDFVTRAGLAIPFSQHICEHLRQSPKQITRLDPGEFLKSCNQYNLGEISKDQLLETTIDKGLDEVLRAFHRLGTDDVPTRFFGTEGRKRDQKIILTEELHSISETVGNHVSEEVEARWRLVETAWDLGINASLIDYNATTEELITRGRRQQVTSARAALNGYQKGKCFYCFRQIDVIPGSPYLADVDHLFPHALQKAGILENLDGVWNLVLACFDCNRGPRGKFAEIPEQMYVDRLGTRNNRLIASHDPLKETLKGQTGKTDSARDDFLRRNYNEARKRRPSTPWETKPQGDPTF